ncbi:dsRNA-specific nuclease [Acrodontium crateriforme]|uniref:Dicer-like protein 1 n=1 Tax=Acrodontium crateriforme TaxID=150365 RepID=A0AAQ3MC19_9PEZI|nr:dsRNA-specific nuclease [Acrodontium crateriforme]
MKNNSQLPLQEDGLADPTPDKKDDLDYDSEDDDELPAPIDRSAASVDEKRRLRNRAFDAFLAKTVTTEASMPSKTTAARNSDASDGNISISNLMARQSAKIVKNPRQYQMELFERAQQENTIAVLDTGSGKTLIAVLLLQWVIDNELQRRADGKTPKVAFFVVASVTLVYQQFSVLETNLDYEIARVSGVDNVKVWAMDRWSKIFSENKVIVCTAEILRQCLGHGLITVKEINLLIFDEAHHTKKNHPFARIVKDHYMHEPEANRPIIFGMTASPIDAKGDATDAAIDLEALLHSKIVTTNDMSLTDTNKKPAEFVARYQPLIHDPPETAFVKTVRALCNGFDMFDKTLNKTSGIVRELGTWCANFYLADRLSHTRLSRYRIEIEQKHNQHGQRNDNVTSLNEKQARLEEIITFVTKERSKYTTDQDMDISEKVKWLRTFLQEQFECQTENRCIVFVKERATAMLLTALFQKLGSQHMKSGYLTGAEDSGTDFSSFTFRQQLLTLAKFRNGEVNCLFATSIAEEGLDIPDCNLVIRFDLYQTMIQYVQSRGRARKQNSKFIHMIETGNSVQAYLVREIRNQERQMRQFCQDLPENRKLRGDADRNDVLLGEEENMKTFVEETTGARLNYNNALTILARFVSAVPTTSEEPLHPTYVISGRGAKFIAEVLIPGDAPIRSVVGEVCGRLGLAKRSAAFEACVLLRRKDFLNEYLMPVYVKKLPAMRNALLAADMGNSGPYNMRAKPSIWKQTRGELPKELYVCRVDFDNGLDRPHVPIAFLTRTRLPQFPDFPLYLIDGRTSKVITRNDEESVRVTQVVLDKLTEATLRVFKDVFSKTYEKHPAKMSYWIVPAKTRSHEPKVDIFCPGEVSHVDHEAYSTIDWDAIERIIAVDQLPWYTENPARDLVGKFLVDRWNGSRKFISTNISETLRPEDTLPGDAAKGRWNGSILNHSVSLFKKSRAEATWNPNQPVLIAEKILLRRNMLAEPTQNERNTRTKDYLCPEPLRISTLPPAFAASCFAWPAVIHRLEDLMIAAEAAEMIGVQCEPSLALAAITKDSDSIGDGQDEGQVNFTHGMGENYERLEFMGDTFLKTTTTIATFVQNPNDHEFDMHVTRMLMLCNKNLFDIGVKLKTYEYIRTMGFSRLWYPDGLKLLEGKGANKKDESIQMKHSVSQKTIADVSEALIGAAFVAHDRPGFWKPEHWENAVKTVTKLAGSSEHSMLAWTDYRAAYEVPQYRLGEVSAAQRDLAQKVEREHPYRFKCPKILKSAFLHPSQPFIVEKIPNYQRLEFLGDALLDLVCVTHLFYGFPGKDPQWLTEHKMAMVSNKFLGAVCINLGFHKHLRHTHSVLHGQILSYATELLDAKEHVGNTKDYWTTVSDPPKCLADIVESYIGALFVDSDFDYGEVQRFFDRNMKPFFDNMSLYDGFADHHPCTRLHNVLQANFGCNDYGIMAKEIPAVVNSEKGEIMAVVMIHGEVLAHSRGMSGRYGKLRVAKDALDKLEGLVPFEFRSRFGCNCHLKAKDSCTAQDVVDASFAGCNV